MPLPQLPVDLGNEAGVTRTAATPADYWDLVARGFTEGQAESNLTPQQKAARTRAAKKESGESTSQDEHNKTEVGTNAD